MGVEPYEQPMFVSPTYRITVLHCLPRELVGLTTHLGAPPSVNPDFGYLDLENDCVTLHLWVRNLKCSPSFVHYPR